MSLSDLQNSLKISNKNCAIIVQFGRSEIMRKGQTKLIERAINYGYDDSRIELLRNEELTIKQLET